MTAANIASYFATHVTPQDAEHGLLAYPGYRGTMLAFGEKYGFGLVPTTEAFVALSPNNDYHGNLRSLASVMHSARERDKLKNINVSTYRACAVRTYSYLLGTKLPDTSNLKTICAN